MGSIKWGTACGHCPRCKQVLRDDYPGKTFTQVHWEVTRSWLLGDALDALSKLEAACNDAEQRALVKSSRASIETLKF